MTRRSRLSLAAAVALGGLLLALPTSASAVKVRGGSAKVTLSPDFRQSLADKGVAVSPTGAASRTGNRLKLKIRRGRVDPKRRRARLRLGGGLRWSASSSRATAAGAGVETNKLTILTNPPPQGRGRITSIFSGAQPRGVLFKLSDVRFRRQGRRITASVSLARAGARELNQALQLGGALSFRPGEPVGPLKLCLGLDPDEPQC